MNAEPELYPREALADDEPRYLRRQKPLEIRRRKFGRRALSVWRRWTLLAAGLLAAGWLAWQGVRFFAYSPLFALADLSRIEVLGNQYVSREGIAGVFEPDLGTSVLRIPLDERREALELIPWIERASVGRALPNRLRVEVVERVPVAFLRAGRQLALVDAAGVILELPIGGDFAFPVVSGLGEAMPLADRERRMRLYTEFLREIELARPGATDHVSEVDLADARDLRATVSGLPGAPEGASVLVHFGDSGFVNKYRLLADNFARWLAGAGRIESVDLRFARQVVVNPGNDQSARAAAGAP